MKNYKGEHDIEATLIERTKPWPRPFDSVHFQGEYRAAFALPPHINLEVE